MYSRAILRTWSFYAIVLAAAASPAEDSAGKLPVPDSTGQAEAMKLVKELYGEKNAAAKTHAQKTALPIELMQKAEETGDEWTQRYVLLKVAMNVATQAADVETAFSVVDVIAKTFKVNSIEAKAGVLTKIAKNARTSEQHAVLAGHSLAMVDQALANDNVELAARLCALALAESGLAREPQLTKQIEAKTAQTRQQRRAFEEVKTALSTLEHNPTDPEANLIVGKYRCFTKGDWDHGISMLALGNDEVLKVLAKKDLQAAESPVERVRLGDGWWELAEKQGKTVQREIKGRAVYWYRKTWPSLSGLMKDKIEKRLNEYDLISLPIPDDKSVVAALRWLERHQMQDGSWSLNNFNQKCNDTSCTGASEYATCDAGATAMALLPFLASGQKHNSKGAYQHTVLNGVQWLLRNQEPDGNLAKGAVQMMYSHGLATIALCEAYGLSHDNALKPAAQKAVNYIVNAQNKTDGGWRYNPGQAGDTSVTAWQVTALTSARTAGLKVNGPALNGASGWLNSVAANRGTGYAYMPGQRPAPSMTAAGLVCRQYLGAKRDDPMLTGGMQYLLKHLPDEAVSIPSLPPSNRPPPRELQHFPDEAGSNIYYLYYANQFMHRMGGSEWQKWNGKLHGLLVRTQVRNASDCANGSWDPSRDLWARRGGRVMMTSFAALILQAGASPLAIYK
jgi:hypothetical protein